MKLNVLLNVIGLCMGVVGAFFLVEGIISVSPSQIVEQTVTKVGFNPELIKSISFQRANSLVGFGLVLMGFALQFIAIVLDEKFIAQKTAYVLCGFIVIATIFGAYKISCYIGRDLCKTRYF